MLTLRVARATTLKIEGQNYLTPDIGVYDFENQGLLVDRFNLMCVAIDCDIQSVDGSGNTALQEIARIEAGKAASIDSDGNAWIAHIRRDKVWFEGLYSQGEGGDVTFEQYKLAVQTYIRFLADPLRHPIEVPFPA